MNTLEETAEFLRRGKRALITGHAMPDGDSVGSVLAMSFLLSETGVECHVITPDPLPAVYDFLPGAERFTMETDRLPQCDLAVILDCTDLTRLGDKLEAYISRVPLLVNIDHHVSNQEFGHCNFVDAQAAATGEIIYDLAAVMGVPVSREIAANLYTAIAMDTGSFRFDNTTDRTHEVIARLIRSGIDAAEINKNLFETKEYVQLKLLGYALNQLKVTEDGRVAWITIPAPVMQELGALDEHADGIINYPRMLEGVEIGLLFREISPGKFKVGFRSKKRIDVNRLASAFGGGGHPRAAGCSVQGDIQEVENKVIDLCIKALKADDI